MLTPLVRSVGGVLWCGLALGTLAGGCANGSDSGDLPKGGVLEKSDLEAALPTASDLGDEYQPLEVVPPEASSNPECNGYAAVTSATSRATGAFVRNSPTTVVVVVDLLSAEKAKGPDVFDELGSVFADDTPCAGGDGYQVSAEDAPPPPQAQEAREVTFVLAQDGVEMIAVTRSWRFNDLIVTVQVLGAPADVLDELGDVALGVRGAVSVLTTAS